MATYVGGPVESAVDYVVVRQDDRARVRGVEVVSGEECVPGRKLLVMDT